MTRDEELKLLRQSVVGVEIAQRNAINNIFETQLLPIVQACCDSGFKVKLDISRGKFWCDLTFDLNDRNKEFGLDFTIRVNNHNQIELTHGWASGDQTSVRQYLIQRDKVIARLWDKNDEIVACFNKVREEEIKYTKTRFEIENQINDIEHAIQEEETNKALEQLKVGSKWVYEWDKKRPLTIVKITDKMIFIDRKYNTLSSDNTDRKKIADMVGDLKCGHLLPYEEEKGVK